MQAVVLAGGRGTRLKGELPKPIAPVNGLPAIAHVLGQLAAHGVEEALVLTGWRADEIAGVVGDGRRHGLLASCIAEAAPLGTAGAVRAVRDRLAPTVIVAYADVIFDVDLRDMAQRHREAGAQATLAVHPNDHPSDSDRVIADRHGQVVRLHRGDDPDAGALCSAALYVIERDLLDLVDASRPSDFARDLFPAALAAGRRLTAWRTAEFCKDMGTAERLAEVEGALRSGRAAQLRRRATKAAVLCDRDGVLVEDRPFIARAEELRLLPSAAPSLARLNRESVLVVACTNQPVVARGAIDEDGLHGLHRRLEGLLGQAGAWLDGIFACPHHPDRGFPGEREDLKIACRCRKPLPGLLYQAEATLGIDRRRSILVGDRTVDLVCAEAAGVLGIGVETGAALADGKHPIAPEWPIVPSLAEAVSLFLDAAPSWERYLARVDRIVAIGGPSRAGKTVAASALRLRLAARGVAARHVSLDRFIVPAAQRGAGGVKERTRFAEAAAAMKRIAAGETVVLPSYDPRTRAAAPGTTTTLGAGEVLIVEGLLAPCLDLPGATKVALHAPAEARRARRDRFYAWKGIAAPTALVEEEEALEVARAVEAADLHLHFDERLRLLEGSA